MPKAKKDQMASFFCLRTSRAAPLRTMRAIPTVQKAEWQDFLSFASSLQKDLQILQ